MELQGGAEELHWPSISVSQICEGQSKIDLRRWVMQHFMLLGLDFQAEKVLEQEQEDPH